MYVTQTRLDRMPLRTAVRRGTLSSSGSFFNRRFIRLDMESAVLKAGCVDSRGLGDEEHLSKRGVALQVVVPRLSVLAAHLLLTAGHH